MKFNNPYWSMALKISALQRYIIVHSYLYYERNENVISDGQFDKEAKQLVKLQNEYPQEAKKSDYWYVFEGFDGSTGFDLYHNLDKADKKRIRQISWAVLRLYKRGG